jgi:hypothetical protein
MRGGIPLPESQDFRPPNGQPSILDKMSAVGEGEKAYIMNENIPDQIFLHRNPHRLRIS